MNFSFVVFISRCVLVYPTPNYLQWLPNTHLNSQVFTLNIVFLSRNLHSLWRTFIPCSFFDAFFPLLSHFMLFEVNRKKHTLTHTHRSRNGDHFKLKELNLIATSREKNIGVDEVSTFRDEIRYGLTWKMYKNKVISRILTILIFD